MLECVYKCTYTRMYYGHCTSLSLRDTRFYTPGGLAHQMRLLSLSLLYISRERQRARARKKEREIDLLYIVEVRIINKDTRTDNGQRDVELPHVRYTLSLIGGRMCVFTGVETRSSLLLVWLRGTYSLRAAEQSSCGMLSAHKPCVQNIESIL